MIYLCFEFLFFEKFDVMGNFFCILIIKIFMDNLFKWLEKILVLNGRFCD